jgi:DNA-directed RNA polymerase specialized sigma24 family protein
VKGKDWQHFVFNPGGRWIERLVRLAERRFPDPAVSGAAYNFAFEKISDNDWRLLEGFTGTAQPGTYLTAVFCRLLEDYSRSRFGRPRPPTWLHRMGEIWTRIYQMLCLERMEPGSIADRLTVRDSRSHAEVHRMIAVIRARISDCGQSRGETAMANPTETLESEQRATTDPESELSQHELAELLRALRSFLDPVPAGAARDPDARANPGASSLAARFAKLRDSLDLDDDERLVLKLVYQDGCTVAAAARALRSPEHQVRRRCELAVSRLREAMLAAGLGPELLTGE